MLGLYYSGAFHFNMVYSKGLYTEPLVLKEQSALENRSAVCYNRTEFLISKVSIRSPLGYIRKNGQVSLSNIC